MKVRNVSGVGRGVIPANAPEFYVEPDATVEVDDDLGKSMCEQPRNWQPVREAANKKEKN